jgi:hypothetical protein
MYMQPEIQTIFRNAVRWAGPRRAPAAAPAAPADANKPA